METFYEMLEELENQTGSIDKEDYLVYILKRVKNAETFFRFAFSDIVYGVKEQTFKNAFSYLLQNNDADDLDQFNHVSEWLETTKFEPMADNRTYKVQDLLVFGGLLLRTSGNAQEVKISNFIRQCETLKKKWFCRAILKDLRCGIKVKTINKAFKRAGLTEIPVFALQLCDKIDVYDTDKMKKKITYPCSIECKYDGIRIQAEIYTVDIGDPQYDVGLSAISETRVILTSRRGNDRTDSYPEIVQALKDKFAGENIILDGEVISKSFQDLTRKDSTSSKKYVIFDLLNDEGLPYKSRWDNLLSLLISKGITDLKDNKNIIYNKNTLVSAEHYSANNIKDIQDYYSDLNKRKEEGIIIKLEDNIYERGSRRNMFKCKKVYTADLLCTGFKYGEGKRTNKVATLCLQDASKTIEVDVGSGINDQTCDWLTEQVNPEASYEAKFIWSIVEIAYNEITETGSIRFPRFITFRDDKDVADDLSREEIRQ